ncbi:L-aminoadipate-semialdehyde dehydrogenase-phosphopantetheinyl transferase [Condylostylus longicornis]|uniref:L-aminoadipate-semialdehyde dehydrogenase-phosphopantetheinyl transferase n=1 Tax=Condylostylus longicornis TaxID=2530218 RepID=UPI00244DAC88|nr:L-aminoadipate-semialdehyde dehydrogenase-phosphopantetheinyl transferase [Condylostylus longicornis]
MSSNFRCIRWAVDLYQWKPSIQELSLAISCIQLEEKERLMKFVFQEDFYSSLVGRLLMRKFVKSVTNISYEKIHFERDENGKPFLTNNLDETQHLSFNVSHQGRYSILAGIFHNKVGSSATPLNCEDVHVGVDVMKIEYSGGKSISEFFRIMNRNFSEDEWKLIKKSSNELNQLRLFMRHWCLKESYVKNIGIGIKIDLKKISFNIKSEEADPNKIHTNTELSVNGSLLDNWKFEEHTLDEYYCAAIAFKNWNKEIKSEPFVILSCAELLENCVPLVEADETYCQEILNKECKVKRK